MARILIIDDDVELANHTALFLRQKGHVVTLLHTSENALPRIISDPPEIILLDVMFPDNPVFGFDLARQIRRVKGLQKLPIILLTSVNQQFPMDFSSKDIDPDWMPVQDLLEKPVEPSVLLAKIDELLKR
ncbi:MAG: response regulator [bacterium]